MKKEAELKFQIEQFLPAVEQTIETSTDNNISANDNKETEIEKPSFIEATEDQQRKQSQEFAPYVIIKKTGTGWLNVRQGPGTGYEIISKINPGEKYQILAEENDWTKIQLPDNLEGWISGKYADKYID